MSCFSYTSVLRLNARLGQHAQRIAICIRSHARAHLRIDAHARPHTPSELPGAFQLWRVDTLSLELQRILACCAHSSYTAPCFHVRMLSSSYASKLPGAFRLRGVDTLDFELLRITMSLAHAHIHAHRDAQRRKRTGCQEREREWGEDRSHTGTLRQRQISAHAYTPQCYLVRFACGR